MPDITMCDGGDCLIKDACYRYTAIPDEYGQSCFIDPPYMRGPLPFKCTKNTYCEHYYPMVLREDRDAPVET